MLMMQSDGTHLDLASCNEAHAVMAAWGKIGLVVLH